MLVACLALAAALDTPDNQDRRIVVGGQVGFDIGKLANYGTGFEKSRTGGLLAAYVALPVWRKLWIQPDVSLTRRNLFATYRSDNPIQLSFVEVAALPSLFFELRPSYLFAGAGPALAIRVGTGESQYPLYYGSPPTDWRRASLELVTFAGIGAQLSHSLAARVEFRYVRGLQDLDPTIDYSDPQLRSWQFRCSLEWRLGR